MARQPITSFMVAQQHVRLNRLRTELQLPITHLQLGNSTHNIHNTLISRGLRGATNLWPDRMGGTSKRDAYEALRVMISTLAEVVECREARARDNTRRGL